MGENHLPLPLSAEDIKIRALSNASYAHIVDNLIEMEANRIKQKYDIEEREYVQQALMANPAFQQLESSKYQQKTDTENNEIDVNISATKETASHTFRRRAYIEKRRQSHYKKAMVKAFHRCISKKLVENIKMYDSLQKLIAQTEAQLIANGTSTELLQTLRERYGIDRVINDLHPYNDLIRVNTNAQDEVGHCD